MLPFTVCATNRAILPVLWRTPGWAGRTAQAALDKQKVLDASRKTGAGYLIWTWTKFILGQGKDYQDDYAKEYRDEMLRRGLAVP